MKNDFTFYNKEEEIGILSKGTKGYRSDYGLAISTLYDQDIILASAFMMIIFNIMQANY